MLKQMNLPSFMKSSYVEELRRDLDSLTPEFLKIMGCDPKGGYQSALCWPIGPERCEKQCTYMLTDMGNLLGILAIKTSILYTKIKSMKSLSSDKKTYEMNRRLFDRINNDAEDTLRYTYKGVYSDFVDASFREFLKLAVIGVTRKMKKHTKTESFPRLQDSRYLKNVSSYFNNCLPSIIGPAAEGITINEDDIFDVLGGNKSPTCEMLEEAAEELETTVEKLMDWYDQAPRIKMIERCARFFSEELHKQPTELRKRIQKEEPKLKYEMREVGTFPLTTYSTYRNPYQVWNNLVEHRKFLTRKLNSLEERMKYNQETLTQVGHTLGYKENELIINIARIGDYNNLVKFAENAELELRSEKKDLQGNDTAFSKWRFVNESAKDWLRNLKEKQVSTSIVEYWISRKSQERISRRLNQVKFELDRDLFQAPKRLVPVEDDFNRDVERAEHGPIDKYLQND